MFSDNSEEKEFRKSLAKGTIPCYNKEKKESKHMAIISEMDITPSEFIDMYDGDLEIIILCREYGKLKELRDYIYEMYACGSSIYDYQVYDELQSEAEELKELFGIEE